MTRREFVWHFVVISAAMLTLAGVAGKLLTAVPHAQSSTPYLEPTSTCPAVSFWFADGVYRLPAGRFAGYQPRLTLYNPTSAAQVVHVRIHSTLGSLTQTVTVPAMQRVGLDIGPLLGAPADFAVEVDFAALGAADLKTWSGVASYTVLAPLAVCRG